MKQQTLAAAADKGAGIEQHLRATKHDWLLATMIEIVPGAAFLRGNRTALSEGQQRFLRMYFVVSQSTRSSFRGQASLVSQADVLPGTLGRARRSA